MNDPDFKDLLKDEQAILTEVVEEELDIVDEYMNTA